MDELSSGCKAEEEEAENLCFLFKEASLMSLSGSGKGLTILDLE